MQTADNAANEAINLALIGSTPHTTLFALIGQQ